MGLFDMLMNTDKMLGEPEIASDMLKDSKFAVISLGKAVTEIANPELRELMESHLLTAIAHHHQLSDLVISRAWYNPFLAPEQQVNQDINMAHNVTSH